MHNPAMDIEVPSEIADVRDALRAAGMRWTPQRRVILDALFQASGHVTGVELVERVQARDADTPPSTVYRTLDMLERLGYVCHSHGRDGREEYHVLPEEEHAHLVCDQCGATWEMPPLGAARADRQPRQEPVVHGRSVAPDRERPLRAMRAAAVPRGLGLGGHLRARRSHQASGDSHGA